jgi:hypothetical protein
LSSLKSACDQFRVTINELSTIPGLFTLHNEDCVNAIICDIEIFKKVDLTSNADFCSTNIELTTPLSVFEASDGGVDQQREILV